MSLTAIVNLAERLLNSSSAQTSSNASSPQTPAGPTQTIGGDQFTPSGTTDSEADAGLFQASQSISFSAAAEFLLSQTPSPQTNPAAATTTPTTNSTPPTSAATETNNGNSAANSNVAANPAITGANTTATATTGATAVANRDTAANSSATSTQNQLQALNNALVALGLNSSELSQVDRIATLINDFSPQAFTSLAYQLEAQANAQESAAGTGSAPTSQATTTQGGTNTPGATAITGATGTTPKAVVTGTTGAASNGTSNVVSTKF